MTKPPLLLPSVAISHFVRKFHSGRSPFKENPAVAEIQNSIGRRDLGAQSLTVFGNNCIFWLIDIECCQRHSGFFIYCFPLGREREKHKTEFLPLANREL